MTVWVLHHVHNLGAESEDVKLIGVYSSESRAQAAIARLSVRPGFDQSNGQFELNAHLVDEDNWTEGFVTLAGDLEA